MKKKFLLIGALVAMSMSAMFVACSKDDKNGATDDKNGATDEFKGCTCEYYDPSDGSSWNEFFSASEMKSQFGASSCSALASAIQADSFGGDFSVRCHE